MTNLSKKIGILGGGQLGKMLYQAGSKMSLNISIMDKSKDFPAGAVCPNMVIGDFSDYDDVMRFGKDKDVLTIEIESVNTEALLDLQTAGVAVHPNPISLRIIKDKGLQKEFYIQNGFPTSSFLIFDDSSEIIAAFGRNEINLPFVQKARKDGYDGRGVQIISKEADFEKLFDTPSIVEGLVSIRKELAVIASRNESGEIKCFPVVEMEFNPTANLVEYLYSPSNCTFEQQDECIQLASALIEAFDICGLLAVEFFLNSEGNILINEVAPRTHNSGHHTIEAADTSQFEQHLRAVLNLPLGNTDQTSPSVMVNLLGENGYTGKPDYTGLEECLKIKGVNVHLYGKPLTKPFRKMGHVTILDKDLDTAIEKAKFVKDTIKIIV
jgi:5-(carboxyamino)imidazole ribonucleotide synthase